MPNRISPDMLTLLGLAGSVVVAIGLALAKNDNIYLAISLAGFCVQWTGDSLDGRLAYFRNVPRKWYGFSLDLCVDWFSTSLIGIGFYYFLPDGYKLLALGLVATYGWSIVMALIKYKITDRYSIDSGYVGPTEFRLALCMGLVLEMLWPGSLIAFAAIVNVALVLVNVKDFLALLQYGNLKDKGGYQ